MLLTAFPGCASVSPMDVVVQRPEATASLRFGVDTFAFPNESRTNNPGKPDLYANYCFVMARGVTQFQRFARFDAAAPRVTPEEYVARIKQVVAPLALGGPAARRRPRGHPGLRARSTSSRGPRRRR